MYGVRQYSRLTKQVHCPVAGYPGTAQSMFGSHISRPVQCVLMQVYGHKLPRNRLRLVTCDACGSTQPITAASSCLHCDTHFAAYYCRKCGIANNDIPRQGYFHCDECGICRVGHEDKYFHCSICNCCLKIELLEVS